MREESWLALTGSVEPSPRFGGLASQSGSTRLMGQRGFGCLAGSVCHAQR